MVSLDCGQDETISRHCSWAHYERATRGEIQLMPPEHSIKVLTDDYRHMQNMIFGDKPSFDEILNCIGKLEAEIHAACECGFRG